MSTTAKLNFLSRVEDKHLNKRKRKVNTEELILPNWNLFILKESNKVIKNIIPTSFNRGTYIITAYFGKRLEWTKLRIDPVPYTGKYKKRRNTILPRRRMFKELNELFLPFVRKKRKRVLQPILDAWRGDTELTPSNNEDRNWKQYSKNKKQWRIK